MIASAEQILQALAVTLRTSIGPNLADPFAKTQAFMAAVVLEKLAGQLVASAADAAAGAKEHSELVQDLRTALQTTPNLAVGNALDRLAELDCDRNWNVLIEEIHAQREALGTAHESLLSQVRVVMRARLNRALAYSS